MEPNDFRKTTDTGPAPALRHPQSGALAHLAPPVAAEATGTATEVQQPPRPLVPPAVAAVLAVLSTLAGFAAGLLSSPASWICAALALVLALVAGVVGFKVPSFTVGRPLVKATMVAPLVGVAGLLVQLATGLPEGYARGGLLLAAVVCAGLAGAPLPQPTQAPK